MNTRAEVSALILRLVLGFTFMLHGIVKFTAMGIGNVAGWFASMGIPSFMAYVVAIIELVGGIAMILGLGTRIVAFLFACVMVGAIVTVKWSAGFMGNGQAAGFEFDVALLAMSVSLILTGSRRWALDAFFGKEEDFR
ncbi:DoxX family protein [Laceyella putida]|uniref:DoxX family protein n=1 Tax=Laceyella putida TaxID=110101 RepID=A0ABW2RNG1_9BACL